jgi:uncharacterized repeat protein (TIGR01451 family)
MVPAGGTTTLTFDASFPDTDGLFVNSAVGFIGIEQIDTTFDTSDDVPATAAVRVGNLDPNAVDDSDTTTVNIPIDVDVLANDSDPEGDEFSITSVQALTNQGGSAVLNDNGTPSDPTDDYIVYTPPPGFGGTDTFTYEITDVYGNTDVATVTITVLEDSDGDGEPDITDIDDDDDGVLDVDEGDGTLDSDGDGVPDSLDIDSDNDGIVDNVEAQAEGAYVPAVGADTDGDGLDDAYDPDNGGTMIVIVDTDGDGTTDLLDLDSDDDNVPDSIEGHDADHDGIADTVPSGLDSDDDGLDDAYDTVVRPTEFNEAGSNSPLQDTDGDGTRDWRDTDDDDDGIDTEDEDANENGDYSDDDGDGDGTPDYLDPDPLVDLVISKTVDMPVAAEGDTVTFTITVTNNGPSRATGITLVDRLPDGVTYLADDGGGSYSDFNGVWNAGALDPGSSAVLNIQAIVDAGTAGTVITNTITDVSQNEHDTGQTPDDMDASFTVSLPTDVDLHVRKTVNDQTPVEGQVITFSLVVTNNGPADATGVALDDLLPAGTLYLSHTGPGDYDHTTGLWSVGNLDEGDSAVLNIRCQVAAGTAGTTITNTIVAVHVDQTDSGISDDDLTESITVENETDLVVVKTVDDATVAEGDTVAYTITVTNNGPAVATGVSVVDLLPVGVTYVSDDSGGDYDHVTGLWTIGTLVADEAAVLNIQATVDAGTSGSVITNVVTEVEVDQDDSNETEDDPDVDIEVGDETDLVLTKTVDDPTPAEGDVVAFILTVVNNGPAVATGVVVTDLMPEGVTYVDHEGDGSYVPETGIWTVGTLADGEGAGLLIEASVDAGTAGTVITNVIVDASMDQNDSNETEDDYEEDIEIENSTDLEVTKTVSDNTPVVGDEITWTITVSNNGPAMATGVAVTDQLPYGVTYISDDGAGSYVSHTGVWTIGTLAAGESAVLNIVTTVDEAANGQVVTNIVTEIVLDQEDSNETQDDLEEAIEVVLDTDNDGVEDEIDIDDDDDGILDVDEGDGEVDTDGDGHPDSLDIDSDNDGIVDNVESQGEDSYIPPTGQDSDGDGLDDAYDPDAGGEYIVPVDTDGDTTPDYLDLDSDDDGVPDPIEGHDANHDGVADVTPLGADSDADGLDDAYDTVDGAGPGNETGSSSPLQDTDGDGTRDWRDIDDDDDELLTEDEDVNGNEDWSDDDHDGDGTPDYLDPDQIPEGDILVAKSAWSDHVSVGGTIGFTITAENTSEVPTDGVTFQDRIPAGFRYVEDSAVLTRAGDDGVIGTDDDVDGPIDVSGDRPVVFGPVSFGPNETVLISYLLRPGAGVVPGEHRNVVVPYRDAEPAGSASGATIEYVSDPTFDMNGIIGKVFHDRDGDGLQEPALATDVTIMGGAAADDFIPGTTTIDTGEGPVALPGGAPLADGIELGNVPGLGEPGSRVIIEADLHGPDVAALRALSAEGSSVMLDSLGELVTGHTGAVAAGVNGQRLVLTREVVVTEPEQDEGEWTTETWTVTKTDTVKLTDVIEPIRFESGKSDIPEGYVERLRAVIDSLSGKENIRLHIVGHTDDERLSSRAAAIYGDNYGLGRSRAEEVGRLLVSSLGLPDSAVSSDSKGPDEPVASNDTPEGMALNRRAEVQVWYDEFVDRSREMSDDVFIEPEPAGPASYRLVVTLTNEGRCEEGVAGARLATPEGLVVVTDDAGRYHLAGIDGARFDRGRNVAIKVDAASLPEDSGFTTENPRVIRVSEGVTERVNFGVTLPDGKSGTAINEGEAPRRDVEVLPDDYFFLVGVANVTAGQNDISGSIEPLSSDYHYDEEVFVDGRVAFYLKGMIQGRYLLTAQLDTEEDEIENLLDGIDRTDPSSVFRRLDPDHYYPVYGDDSVTTLDTDTQGRFYLRLDWDESEALWGNFNTGITGTEFARYNRSLYGAMIHYGSVQSAGNGDHRAEITGFASEAQTAAAHNEFEATGGSLYYLMHGDVVQGSEKAWVEVRERETSRVVENIELVRGRDYEMDEIQGRIILARPLTQVAGQEGPSIVKDVPLDGNGVFLLVDYEYVPSGFEPDDATYGGRAKAWLTDEVAVGGTYVQEGRGDTEYELKGVDLTLAAGDGTYVKAEYTESASRQVADAFTSEDGGLSFAHKNADEPPEDMAGEAMGVEARFDFDELTDGDVGGALAAWWKQREAGFSISRLTDGVETTEYGGEGSVLVGDALELSARGAVAERDGVGTDETYSVQADYDVTDRWDVGAEVRLRSHEPDGGDKTESTLGAARIGFDLTRSLNVYGIGQFTIDKSDGVDDNNLGTLGLRGRVGRKLALRAEGSSGDLGRSANIGADYDLDEAHTMYGTYTLSSDHTGADDGVLTLGQRRSVSDQLRVFTEHQFAHEDDVARVAQVYGADYDVSEWSTIGVSLQSSALEADAGDVERDVATVSASYGRERTRLGAKLEYRKDSGACERTQWLTTNSITFGPNEDLTLMGKVSLSQTEEEDADVELAKFVEAGVGFAYRPVCGDRLNLLGKFTYLSDLSTEAQSADDGVCERTQTMSLEGMYPLGHRFELGGKFARKQGEIGSDRGAGTWYETTANFAAARARYHLAREWDGLVEYRWLKVDETDDSRQGALAGIYRAIGENLRIGVGYNFTDFSDDLGDLSYESHGWFIDVVGSY